MNRSIDLLQHPPQQLKGSLAELLRELGEPAYRVEQIGRWIYQRAAADFASMSDLPRRLRTTLEERCSLHRLVIAERRRSRDGSEKFLWQTESGKTIESVRIPDGRRVTYCISSQAGCPVRCTFCATGHGGFAGNLSASEIVDQVLLMRRLSTPPTNIVFMGMGEPLLNYAETARSIEVLTDPRGLGLSPRRITVSTVGIPHEMVRLNREFPQVKLAVSVHATTNADRERLIPINRRYPLEEVWSAIDCVARESGKKITLEYLVLPGVNDRPDDAHRLAQRARRVPSRINLIGFNPFPGVQFHKPTVAQLVAFRKALAHEYRGTVTIRRSRGEDIGAACGQLTHRREDK